MGAMRPQLSPAMIDAWRPSCDFPHGGLEAAVHVIQHHFTFPEGQRLSSLQVHCGGIRMRLHRLLFEECGDQNRA